MGLRVLLFGVAWMAVIAITILIVRPVRPGIAVKIVSVLPDAPPGPPKAGTRYPGGWTVTRAYSAHSTMVVEVETERPSEAMTIAHEVVEPLKYRYDEVLIYTRQPEAPDAARRVQWTPRGGYVEIALTPER
jgi:hypothetical protein